MQKGHKLRVATLEHTDDDDVHMLYAMNTGILTGHMELTTYLYT